MSLVDSLIRAQLRLVEKFDQGILTREPRTGYWSGNNAFGQAQPIPFGKKTAFKLDESGFPTQWTARISVQYTPQNSTTYPYAELLAEVSFGVGGVMQTCVINVQNGTTISGPANSIEMCLFWEGNEGSSEGFGQNTHAAVTLSRMPSTNPNAERWISSTAPAEEAPAEGPRVVIPPFARRVKLMGRDDTTAAGMFAAGNYLHFRVGGGILVGSVELDGLNPGVEIPIPAFAKEVSVLNAGATDLTFRYAFSIGF